MSFSGSEKELKKTIRQGMRIKGDIAYIKYLRNSSKSTRFAVITPKTVEPSAVKRNRVRRIFSEAFRQIKNELPFAIDVVVFPGKKSIGKTMQDARNFFDKCFGRA